MFSFLFDIIVNLQVLICFPSTAKKPEGIVPEFFEPLKPVEVTEGGSAKLECTVKVKPEPVVEWFKDGLPVKVSSRVKISFDGETARLKLADVVLNDEGEYKCTVTNDLGSVSCTTELLVNESLGHPEFKDADKDQTIVATEGDEARMDVQVSGGPGTGVDWYKGKDRIEDEGRFVLIDDEEEDLFSLIIEDVKTEDAGRYKCVAFNDVGESTCVKTLRVEEMLVAPEFIGDQQTAPLVIQEGDNLNLDLKIKGKPAPELTWYKEDNPVRKSSRLDTPLDGEKCSLVIREVNLQDAGRYRCEARNNAGTQERTFDVIVEGNVMMGDVW